ncbi:MAG: hypothetical protein MZV63_47720 [Marinilabiliales bacterium]|nr:hypothetical protein [Marinilabiliales bacterium]
MILNNNRFASEMSDGRMNFSGILLNEIMAGRVVAYRRRCHDGSYNI